VENAAAVATASNLKTIALAFLQVQWFVYHPGAIAPLRERMQGRFSSCVALTITFDGISRWRF